MSPDYKAAWEELNRILPPSRTDGVIHDCGVEDHEESVDLIDCIAERFEIDQ